MSRYQSLAPWRGCKNVMYSYYDDYADPDLLYKGYNFNYWDIEDALRENFESDCANGIEGLLKPKVAMLLWTKPSMNMSARTPTLTSMMQLPTDISLATLRAGTTKCKPLSKGA